MDIPTVYLPYSAVPEGRACPPQTLAAPSKKAAHDNPENRSIPTHADHSRRTQWVARIIEAQASRIIHDTADAVELKPVTIENRPPANIRRFLEVAVGRHTTCGAIIDTYA